MPATFIQTPLGQTTPAPDWIANHVYAVSDKSKNDTSNYNTYIVIFGGKSAASGGPTGTGDTIVDGTVTWKYVGPSFPVMYKTSNPPTGTTVWPDDMAYNLFVNMVVVPSPSNPTILLNQYMTVYTTSELFTNGISQGVKPNLYAKMTVQFG